MFESDGNSKEHEISKEEIIKKTREHFKNLFEKDSTGHDWWHIERVYNLAVNIAQKEGTNLFLVELGALLHDVEDYKFEGYEGLGKGTVRKWLQNLNLDERIISQTINIVENVGFKGSGKTVPNSIEGMIVQDADRLDGLGAIGIARTFAFGGAKGRLLFDPNRKLEEYQSLEQYKNSSCASINHFYEKLLKLKDLMNTNTAKEIAKERHEFMEMYLEQFFKEWEGKV